MAKMLKHIECHECTDKEIPEQRDPLVMQLPTGDAVTLFGFPYFYCDDCGSVYMPFTGEDAIKLTDKLEQEAATGVNCVVW